MDATGPMRPGHAGLVGLPVFLTMVFCFALIMAHAGEQAGNASRVASAGDGSQTVTKIKPDTLSEAAPKETLPEYKVVPVTPVHLSNSDEAAPVDSTPSSTDTPQKTVYKAGYDAGQSLQSAGQNSQSDGQHSTIKSVAKPPKINLLNNLGL